MKIFLTFFILLIFMSCQQNHPLQKEYPDILTVRLVNSTAIERPDELVEIDLALMPPNFNPRAFVVVDDQKELASQATDWDGDGSADQIAFLCDFKASETKEVKILFAIGEEKERQYKKRTQAEISHKVGGHWEKREYMDGTFQNADFLSVPPEHTDHSWFIRYEGPGWESDRVGYRFYLDWRNAVDVFGKKTPEMVLQNVGLDGFDSYHEMSSWGMDILKVGSSLGIGSIAMWIADSAQRVEKTDSMDCRIVTNGVIQSAINTNYYGWHINNNTYHLNSLLTINAASRLTRCDLKLDSNPDNLATGLVKIKPTEIINSADESSTWQYLATWGKQSLNNDNLGMAVFYKNSTLDKIAEDKHSYVIVLKPADGQLTYYYAAAWELEPDGIKDKDSFVKYLDITVTKLNNPVSVELK